MTPPSNNTSRPQSSTSEKTEYSSPDLFLFLHRIKSFSLSQIFACVPFQISGEIAFKKAAREKRKLQHAVKMGNLAHAYEEKERMKMDEFRKAMGLPPALDPDSNNANTPVMIGPRPPVQ
eukprot:c7885_g1_i2.p2 GENE.c7885_g1_i2~~c7885_g1_i2.p2  ORF type:complete len:120 (-),score=28.56 c7885_g1_i2:40-399(-)